MFYNYRFPYGNSILTASLPATIISMVLERQQAKGLDNVDEALLAALRSPVGCPPLRDCVIRNSRVVIIVTDNTRACPDKLLLPPLLSELEQKTDRENIMIIIALGLHPPLSKTELVEKLGENVVKEYHVFNHDINQTVRIGISSAGIPVEINRCVVAADFRISTGYIEPHFFAGFSGGGKSIMPGVSSREAISKNHSFKMLEHPLARAGILQGNPVRADIEEQAKMAGLNFIVNVLLNQNQEITHIVAGDPVAAYQMGCELEKSFAGVRVNHKVDITITSNSGAPLDLDLYQTCKGIETASLITRDGGIVIMASACSAGIGPEAFRRLHSSALSAADVLQKIKREEPAGVPWQNQILARTQIKNDVYLVSELDASPVRAMMMTPVPSIEEGLNQALQMLGNNAEVAIIPKGPLVLPILGETLKS